jgi:superfamily I DNA/RNA helicase
LLAWAAPFTEVVALRDAIASVRERIGRLRTDGAPLTLATVHGTKGLEWDHVAVIGLEAGRFPSGRSVRESPDPRRALEEERRLAYVAWTRARVSLTLVYDPATPSPFLLEAFDADELGIERRDAATIRG